MKMRGYGEVEIVDGLCGLWVGKSFILCHCAASGRGEGCM